MIAMVFAATVAALSTPGLEPQDGQCRIIAYAADGTRTETSPSRPYSRPTAVGMKTSSGGGGSSHVSVSSSSSSSSGGASVVRASIDGRTITKTYDDKGCTVVIDARPDQGAAR